MLPLNAIALPSTAATTNAAPLPAPLGARGNAVQHGLSATTLLPEILGPELLAAERARLAAEWQPRSPTEELLVNEIARHAAALHRAEQFEDAVLRIGALAGLALPVGLPADHDGQDQVLSAAVTSDGAERLTRYRRTHEKGLYAALDRLREVQRARRLLPPAPAPPVPDEFATEADCAAYLRRRIEGGGCRCPRCDTARASWLAERRRWQCRGCRGQFGVRSGTVLERSPLPLHTWFAIIRCVVQDPDVPLADLVRATSLRRRSTLQAARHKVLAALQTPETCRRLAGLDAVFRPPQPRSSAAPGGAGGRFLQNGSAVTSRGARSVLKRTHWWLHDAPPQPSRRIRI